MIPSDASGPLLPGVSEVSRRRSETIDDEVRRIVEEAHADVTRLLNEHRDKLESLTARLLEKETLDKDEAYEAAGVAVPRRARHRWSSALDERRARPRAALTPVSPRPGRSRASGSSSPSSLR